MSCKSGKMEGTGKNPKRRLAQGVRHADNYGIKIVDFDAITEGVLVAELALLLEHLGAEIAADNYPAE